MDDSVITAARLTPTARDGGLTAVCPAGFNLDVVRGPCTFPGRLQRSGRGAVTLAESPSIVARPSSLLSAVATVAAACLPGVAMAAEEVTTDSIFGAYGFFWLLGLAGACLALYKAWDFFKWMESQSPGTERDDRDRRLRPHGADAYLWQQYKVVAAFFVVIFLPAGADGLRAERAERAGCRSPSSPAVSSPAWPAGSA